MTDKWQAGKTYVPGSLVVPASAVPVVMPPLVNGDFETGDLSNWTATAQPGNWSISNFAYRGTYCLHCVGGNVATIRNDTRGQVEAGTQVSAQAVANFHNNGTDDMGCELALYWYDASDAFISQDEGASLTGKGGSYKAFSVLGYAPTNAKFVRLVIGANTGTHGGDISFDNVTWSSNYSAPPSGLVYKATQAAPGKSGTSEPSWPGVTGVPVTDNQVTWEGVIATRIVWEAIPLLKSGDTEPVWPEDISGMVSDGAINWKAISRRIEDVNCPQSKIVAIMASKVFAADKDIVRFSATVNPLDWTSGQDAGFLPTGLQQANANDMAVLAPYRSNMTAFNASSFQNWQVDPDPSAMALLDQMEGIGSTWQHAAQPVGNELFYLSQLGVRSVSIAAGADSLSASDVGIPIDALVQLAMKADVTELGPLAIYYPSSGQYWLAFPGYAEANGTTGFVCTLNGGKPKWSRYVFPWSIDNFSQLGNSLYVRHGDEVSIIDEDVATDDVEGIATPFPGIVQWPWMDNGAPGVTKMMESIDYVGTGQGPKLSIGYDQRDVTAFTEPYQFDDDTLPGSPIPLPIAAPTFSIRLDFAGGQPWSVNAVTLNLDNLGGQP